MPWDTLTHHSPASSEQLHLEGQAPFNDSPGRISLDRAIDTTVPGALTHLVAQADQRRDEGHKAQAIQKSNHFLQPFTRGRCRVPDSHGSNIVHCN